MFLLSSFSVIKVRALVRMAHGKYCSDFQTQFLIQSNVLFYIIFSSFRWRRTHSNGTGGCIFKKVGVRKTIVITSITFLPELSLIFSGIIHMRSKVFWTKTSVFQASHAQSSLP